ncbi:MAG: hypothetical protein PUP91_37480, partial [Rhizonema sp. PD37]|nr:hypothetical protein [Rhizonema sp. PD37]
DYYFNLLYILFSGSPLNEAQKLVIEIFNDQNYWRFATGCKLAEPDGDCSCRSSEPEIGWFVSQGVYVRKPHHLSVAQATQA